MQILRGGGPSSSDHSIIDHDLLASSYSLACDEARCKFGSAAARIFCLACGIALEYYLKINSALRGVFGMCSIFYSHNQKLYNNNKFSDTRPLTARLCLFILRARTRYSFFHKFNFDCGSFVMNEHRSDESKRKSLKWNLRKYTPKTIFAQIWAHRNCEEIYPYTILGLFKIHLNIN